MGLYIHLNKPLVWLKGFTPKMIWPTQDHFSHGSLSIGRTWFLNNKYGMDFLDKSCTHSDYLRWNGESSQELVKNLQ